MKTSVHIEPVKPASEIHNQRRKELSYVRPDLTAKNQKYITKTHHHGLATISTVLKGIKDNYSDVHKKNLPKNSHPIREAVIVCTEQTTMKQLHEAAKECYNKFKIIPFQYYLHKDEGHYDNNGEWKPNYHAHIIFSWYDMRTGKTIKLSRQDCSEIQEIFATHLGMERGLSSDKKHLTTLQQKVAAVKTQLEELNTENGINYRDKAQKYFNTIEILLGSLIDIHEKPNTPQEVKNECMQTFRQFWHTPEDIETIIRRRAAQKKRESMIMAGSKSKSKGRTV